MWVECGWLSVYALFRGSTESFVVGKAQSFHESLDLLFHLGKTLVQGQKLLLLTLKFLVFRAGNGDHFGVACLEVIRLIHGSIIP